MGHPEGRPAFLFIGFVYFRYILKVIFVYYAILII